MSTERNRGPERPDIAGKPDAVVQKATAPRVEAESALDGVDRPDDADDLTQARSRRVTQASSGDQPELQASDPAAQPEAEDVVDGTDHTPLFAVAGAFDDGADDLSALGQPDATLVAVVQEPIVVQPVEPEPDYPDPGAELDDLNL